MRYLLFCILLLLPAISNAQVTGVVYSGAMYNHSSAAPVIPYQQEVLDYQDSLWANGITDTVTGIDAINWLVWSLKGNNPSYPHNFWDSLVAVYPYHGGTAYSHSINFRNVGGTKVTWVGGMTHNANGATGDGSTGFGRTGITYPVSNERMSGMLVSVYNMLPNGNANMGTIGVSNNPNNYIQLVTTNGSSPPPAIFILLSAYMPNMQPIVVSNTSDRRNGTMYGQNDNRYADSGRVWISNGYYQSVVPTRQTGNSGSIRQYGVVGRITNAGATASFPYVTATHTFSLINEGALDITQGRWLVEIVDEYNFKLRGFTANL